MADVNGEQNEKKLLLDIVRDSERLQDHLGYIVDYLRNNIPFLEMLDHAEALPEFDGSSQRYPDFRTSVESLEKFEDRAGNKFSVVREYIAAVADYIEKRGSFETVDKFARKIIRLKIDPKISRIPKDSLFYKGDKGCTLAEMREIV
ncbi:MAG: hypothetical protein KAT43_04755 [Nanoarchaeota archaeon]|nr:hypothetical protein [Nanoarchaeota archaeon]